MAPADPLQSGILEMLPLATVEHQLPSRIRLRIRARRGDNAFFAAAEECLTGMPSVTGVTVNAESGSVLIRFSGETEALSQDAAEKGLFSLELRKTGAARSIENTHAAEPARRFGPMTPTAIGLSSLGLYQIAQGRILGSASENLWNAYGAYRILNSPSLALLLSVLGLWQLLKGQWLGSASALLFYALVAQRIADERAELQPASGSSAAP